MPRYTVQMTRTARVTQTLTTTVEAADRLEAEEIGFYTDGDWETDAVLDTDLYRLVGIEKVPSRQTEFTEFCRQVRACL